MCSHTPSPRTKGPSKAFSGKRSKVTVSTDTQVNRGSPFSLKTFHRRLVSRWAALFEGKGDRIYCWLFRVSGSKCMVEGA